MPPPFAATSGTVATNSGLLALGDAEGVKFASRRDEEKRRFTRIFAPSPRHLWSYALIIDADDDLGFENGVA